jgi:hypothetical protein
MIFSPGRFGYLHTGARIDPIKRREQPNLPGTDQT